MSEINNDLLKRIQELEDREAIRQLVAAHPLSVDGGAKESWMALWTEDAVTDKPADPTKHSGDYEGIIDKDHMLAELKDPAFIATRQHGLCHHGSLPYITINGDTAAATNYLQLVAPHPAGQGYVTAITVVSSWEFARIDGQWKITKRIMRGVGQQEAIDLMTKVLPYGAE